MHHERPAAHVAVRAEELLPEVLDARRVLAVEQLEQRLGQPYGDARRQLLDLAPAMNAMVGVDADVCLGPNRRGLEPGDAQRRGAVLHVGCGVVGGTDGVGEQHGAGGEGGRGQGGGFRSSIWVRRGLAHDDVGSHSEAAAMLRLS